MSEQTGKIVAILNTQSGQGRNGEMWVKNAFVIQWTENGYQQSLCLEVMGADKFEKMKNAVAIGNDVLVKYNVTSREWNGRWFTTATCFYCSNVGGQRQTQTRDDSLLPF
jgi:hypothetical protein